VTAPQEIVGRWREAFNAHDEAGIRSAYADDVIFEAPGDIRMVGAGPTVEYAMNWLRAFPDATMQVETEVVDREWVVQRFLFEGTHENALEGPTGDIPATGRRLVGRGVQVTRVEDGQIAEDYLYFDQVQVLMQLGLMPELAARR
jgi:steroid delta-isomerase-like uncharacterized protein